MFNVQPAYQGASATITASLNVVSGAFVQGDWKWFVYDVTNSVLITPYNNDILPSTTLTATFQTTPVATTPANQQYRLGIYRSSSNATASVLKLDNFLVAPGQATYVAQARHLGTLRYAPTASCNFDRVNSTFGTISAVAACATPVVTGSIIAPGTKIPGFVLPALGAGRVEIKTSGYFYKSNTGELGTFRLYDGTNGSDSEIGVYTNAGDLAIGTLTAGFTYSTAQPSKTIEIQSKASAGTASVSAVNIPLTFEVNYFPTTAETIGTSEVYKVSTYLANGTRVTSTPDTLGQYRAKYKTTNSFDYTAWTDTAPSAAPSVADGINIFAQNYAAAGSSGQVTYTHYESGITPLGMLTSYDPTTGVLFVSAGTHGSQATSGNYLGISTSGLVSSGFFDITVSKNPIPFGNQTPNCEWYVDSSPGKGSSNTVVDIFSNVRKNTGTCISRATSSTAGDSYTVLENGNYNIRVCYVAAAAAELGISIDSPGTITTAMSALTYANGHRAFATTAQASYGNCAPYYGYLTIGQVIRSHGNTTAGTADARTSINILKASN